MVVIAFSPKSNSAAALARGARRFHQSPSFIAHLLQRSVFNYPSIYSILCLTWAALKASNFIELLQGKLWPIDQRKTWSSG